MMAKQGNSTAVPRLRFPEFSGAEEWIFTPLGSLAILKNGYPFKSSTYAPGNFRIVTIANVQSGQLFLEDANSIARLPADIQDHQILQPGDILISMTGNVGRVCLVDSPDLLLNQRVGKLVPYACDLRFFYQALQREEFRKSMQLRAAGGAQGNLSVSDITELLISTPPDVREQKKIADCLTSLDEVIAAQGRIVAALKKYKRGLMQQLFPREGETRPRLRFPEFRDAPEWKKLPLCDLGEIVTGKTPSTTDAERWGGDVLFITPTDISENNKYQRSSQRTVVATPKLKVLPAGSITYTCIASIGKMAITVRPSITNQQINSVVTLPTISNEFVYYALANLTPWIKSIPASSTLAIINKKDFSGIDIWIPVDSSEQKVVADCLSSLDTQIAAETDQLAALKTHKQGLMQQLFPAPGQAP